MDRASMELFSSIWLYNPLDSRLGRGGILLHTVENKAFEQSSTFWGERAEMFFSIFYNL